MAIKDVEVRLSNTGAGISLNLTYDEATGTYKGTITAPSSSSYNYNDEHYFPVTVIATDDAGNSTTESDYSGSFRDQLKLRVIEKVAPNITGMTITDGAYITNAQPTFSFEVTDNDSGVTDSNVIFTVDGSAIAPSGAGLGSTATENGYTFTYTPTEAFADGAHVFTIDATDNDGNAASTVTVNFTVDTVAPTLVITEPEDNSYTNQKSITITGSAGDATSTPVTLSVNGETATVNADGTFTYTYSGLTEGTNLITIIAVDAAGKQTTVTRTIHLDTSAPVFESITITPNPVDAGQTFVITVKVSDKSSSVSPVPPGGGLGGGGADQDNSDPLG